MIVKESPKTKDMIECIGFKCSVIFTHDEINKNKKDE